MNRLDQVVLDWPPDHVVTLTVRVTRRDGKQLAPERRLAELIAAELWMAAQGLDAPAERQ